MESNHHNIKIYIRWEQWCKHHEFVYKVRAWYKITTKMCHIKRNDVVKERKAYGSNNHDNIKKVQLKW